MRAAVPRATWASRRRATWGWCVAFSAGVGACAVHEGHDRLATGDGAADSGRPPEQVAGDATPADATTDDESATDSGNAAPDGALDAGCPGAMPLEDAACDLPEGTACAYYLFGGCCGPYFASCWGGRWSARMIGTCWPPAPLFCPPALPAPESPCTPDPFNPPCALPCAYAEGACLRHASCEDGGWSVSSCPRDGGVQDAGRPDAAALDASDGGTDGDPTDATSDAAPD